MARVSGGFSSGTRAERIQGSPPPPTTPLGGVGGVGEGHSPNPASDRKRWLRETQPTNAGWVDSMAKEFGRENFQVTFASENGHVVGKPFSDDGGVKLSETSISGSLVAAKK